MARKNYTSKGERKNVAKWIRKTMKRERTGFQRANAQLDAFWEGKNVVLLVPNINKHETNKPFVRINAKDVWSRNKYIMKHNSQISYK